MVDLGGAVRGYAGVFAAVSRRQFLEDEQAEELGAALFDLRVGANVYSAVEIDNGELILYHVRTLLFIEKRCRPELIKS